MIRLITKVVFSLREVGRLWHPFIITVSQVKESSQIPRNSAICILLSHVSVVQRLKSGGFQKILLASVFLTRTITGICCIYRASFIKRQLHCFPHSSLSKLLWFSLSSREGFPAPGPDLSQTQEGSWALRRRLGATGPVTRPQGVRPRASFPGAPARHILCSPDHA